LFIVMAVAAIARRDVPPALAGAAGLGIALLVSARGALPGISSAYLPFAYPGQTWWQKVVRGRASVYLPEPFSRHPETTLLVVLPILAAVTMWLVRRHRRIGAATGAFLLAAQLAVGVGAAGWALANYTQKAGDEHGPGFRARTWVDQNVPPNEIAPAYVAEPGPTANADAAELRFWNARASAPVLSAASFARRFHWKTGKPKRGLPGFVLISLDRTQRVGLVGQPVATSAYRPIQLWKTSPRTRASWVFSYATPDGWIDGPRTRILIRTWQNCVKFKVTAPPDSAAAVRLQADHQRSKRLRLTHDAERLLRTDVPGIASLILEGNGSLPPDRRVAGLITEVRAVPCVPRAGTQ
jgi:hypothetical protein